MSQTPTPRLRFKHSFVEKHLKNTSISLPMVECFVELPLPQSDGIKWIVLGSGQCVKHSSDNDDKVYARTVAAWRALTKPGIQKDLRRDLLKTIRLSHRALSHLANSKPSTCSTNG